MAMKTPIYLSGAINKALANRPEYGFMRTPNMGNKVAPEQTWFADNGCFSSKGERAFDLAGYLAWLGKQSPQTCIGATAPDKVGDAYETTKRSLPVLPLLREAGYKASYVGQDGLRLTSTGQLEAVSPAGGVIPVPWASFDVLFIGGTTEWKLSLFVVELVAAASIQGKWVHMGRVNSYKRFMIAALMGCDSVDGTFLAFGPTVNLVKLESWVVRCKAVIDSYGGNNENSISVRRDKWPIGCTVQDVARNSKTGTFGILCNSGPDDPRLPG